LRCRRQHQQGGYHEGQTEHGATVHLAPEAEGKTLADEDLTEADTLVRNHSGIENDEIGQLLARLVRHTKVLTAAVKDLRDRVTELETR
jgi:hypothetical protein